MTDPESAFRAKQRDRLQQFLQLREEIGHEQAWEHCLSGYAEKQRSKMGPLIAEGPLIDGFRRAVPMFARIGIQEEVLDISDESHDAVLEISKTCMCCNACADAEVESPLPVLCELDFAATRRAFPEMTVTAERRQVDGALLCIFKYSRPPFADEE